MSLPWSLSPINLNHLQNLTFLGSHKIYSKCLFDNGNFSYGYSLLDGFLVSPPQYDFHADSLGKWELLNNKEVLRFRHYNIESNDTYKLVDWTILKLKTTHLTLFREHNGNTIRLEFYRRGRSDHFKRIRTN